MLLIDWEREGTRLQALYAAMSNEELQELTGGCGFTDGRGESSASR